MKPTAERVAWIGAVALAGFVVVAALVGVGATAGMDAAAQLATEPWRGGLLGEAAYVATLLGYAEGLVPVAVVAGMLLARRRRWVMAALPLSTLVVSGVISTAAKCGFEKARPLIGPWLGTISACDQYAFPSGHAMNSAALYGLLALLVSTSPSGRGRRPAMMGLALMPVLIGLSRVVLGVHWVSDVTGGWLAGVAVASVALLVGRWIDESFTRE